MCATPEPGDPGAGADDLGDLSDLDPEDAFGHPSVADPTRDEDVWPDGDEDDIDV